MIDIGLEMLLVEMQLIHRGIFMVLSGDLRTSEMQIVINHLESGMSEDLPQAENITTVKKIIRGEGVTAKMSMQSFNTRGLGKAREHQLHRIDSYRVACRGREEVVEAGSSWFRPHFVDVAKQDHSDVLPYWDNPFFGSLAHDFDETIGQV